MSITSLLPVRSFLTHALDLSGQAKTEWPVQADRVPSRHSRQVAHAVFADMGGARTGEPLNAAKCQLCVLHPDPEPHRELA
jgi:hypothetical protein